MKKLTIYLIQAIILIGYVSALGIAPSHHEILFEPNTVHEIKITIINNNNKDMKLVLIPKQDLAPYIQVPDKIIHIKKDEYSKDVTYKVTLPEKLTPGTRTTDLLLVQIDDKENLDKENIIKASLGIIHQLRVLVPYPDQYLQGSIYTPEFEYNKSAEITISMVNLGNKKIDKITGSIIISDQNNQGLAYIDTTEVSLDPKEKGKITATWKVNVNPGRYTMQAIIQYNDKILLLSKEIDIGRPFVEITDLRTYPFRLGTIAKLDVSLKNNWNKIIQNVYSQVQIKDQEESIVSDYETGTTDLPAYGLVDLPIYWDTKGVNEGEYNFHIKTFYMGRFTEKIFETLVSEDSIYVKGSTPTGEVTGSRSNVGTPVAALVLILIIIIIILLLKNLKRPKIKIPEESRLTIDRFIKKKLNQGYSPDAIRKNLMKKGWNKDLIDDEMMKIEDNLNI